MILRLVSGSVTPASASRNCSAASTVTRWTPVAATKSRSTCSRLARAQQPVVDEHAGQLVADGPLHQRGGHRGVDAAGQPADHLLVADLRADRLDLLVEDVGRRPVGAMPATSCRKCSAPAGRTAVCSDLGVALHAGQPRGRRSRTRRPGRRRVAAVTVEPVGRRRRPSRRGSSTPAERAGQAAQQRRRARSTVSWVRAVLAPPVLGDRRRRGPGPSPGSRSRCRTPARRRRTAPGRPAGPRRRRRWTARRRG